MSKGMMEYPSPVTHLVGDDKIQDLRIENERLRHVVSDCAAALVSGAFISPKASVEFMEKIPREISITVSRLRKAMEWRDIGTAPKTGEEFIARAGHEWPGFSCFWDGEAFVHLDPDDGVIRYSPTEWMPMPSAALASGGQVE